MRIHLCQVFPPNLFPLVPLCVDTNSVLVESEGNLGSYVKSRVRKQESNSLLEVFPYAAKSLIFIIKKGYVQDVVCDGK
jgi:hypothetical protein